MTVLDPNILNPFTLLDPNVSQTISFLITIISVCFSSVISWHFFRSYKFSGFGYLLGLPAGFAFLAFSLVFEHFSLMYSHDDLLYPVFFWIQLALQSEALALIALSYRFKNSSAADGDYDDADDLGVGKHIHDSYISTKARIILSSSLPMIMVTIPFVVPISELISGPGFNYSGLADMSFFIRIYDMAVLGYVFSSAVLSLIKAANIKLLYIPAAFALLWLEQYSLTITYFDNSVVAFIGSLIARISGLTLFICVVFNITYRRRRRMEIEARKKT
jgi:hypothetical protein